ncbi:UDP-N-acetylmuramate dehydrogenase [Clostridium perfringens]|uniref:UDP-N-acetylenolpyruvoylglucosamine reductase n=2 Tax=Clostridium perfringens TaxID=1502 RepID=MURB_CLOPS|nr:UDP-N-acetylmuramate dehydrogenase [Clostridium perfringens]Q0SW37.1 RecName: Full=UDP-N-acetylenolpyruvoylglucosamine reductase; AltName: Full=UDP-N-acetylmuramate dehydrogenase [Clostridium perfringens SM101]ABG86626.1 UDP-N-acetylmuramate dehydrogenase [Clostridium perfringens SM101]EIF2087247.1 UDP-N-acetylmuramate dehydrogenase [Clostridium perfringens]EJT5917005.1 UDP-N-acetylmuramate dehydrogenase [Clostridium perfringens]EJT5922798.1 UDP-N-acetylmuramate dehydrogenase [Clostridium p
MNQYMEFYKLLGEFYNEEDITVDSPMSEHIYFRVGGPADILVTPVNEEQVVNTLKLCREYNVPYFILGNGSNILVKDGGISGVVIKFNKLNKITTEGNCVTAQSGALLKDVSKAALENNLRGFEFACGIPGSIGGAVFMNAGAYDGEMAHVIKSARVIDENCNIKNLTKEELELGYRSSIVMKKGYVVIEATIELESGEYASIKDKIDDLTNRRESKQPLEYPSAGSTFKRPEGYFAGKLIQDSGLKGFSIGGAAVSEKHSGFVINKGGATAKDVLDVIAHVQKTVKENFDVELHTEVRIIGRD